jgi:hypothetical protein
MPKSEIDKFVSASTQATQRSATKTVEVGPTVWMLGAPAPAADGLIALATSATQTVYFRREDLVEARETEGRFLIRIAQGANVMVREEQVLKLTPPSCHCQEPSGTIESKKGGGDTGPIINCAPTCWVELVCGPFREPFSGAVIIVCWPSLVCGNPCEGVLV